jgi:hypothetical protein
MRSPYVYNLELFHYNTRRYGKVVPLLRDAGRAAGPRSLRRRDGALETGPEERRSAWSSMVPVTDGKPYAALGTSGQDTRAKAQLQVFISLVVFGMDVQETLVCARYRQRAARGPGTAYRTARGLRHGLVTRGWA